MGRPRKVVLSSIDGKDRRPLPFNEYEPCGLAQSETGKYLVQGGAYYSYAEPIGPFDPKRGSRKLIPHPKFVGWSDEIDAKTKLDDFYKLKEKRTALDIKIAKREKELKDFNIIEEPENDDLDEPVT